MVRHYKRIKEKSYSERQRERAVDAVKERRSAKRQNYSKYQEQQFLLD